MTAVSGRAAAIEDAAARWLIRRDAPGWSAREDDELRAWLDESMAHRAAFWRLAYGWEQADRVAALGPEGVRACRPRRLLSRRAAAFAGGSPVAGIAAAAVLLVAGGAWRWMAPGRSDPRPAVAAYHTPVGGRQSLRLADGSRIEMNTATRLRAPMRGDGREVWLDDGEAFFDIVHRPDRGFVVHAGPRTVTVLGTRFSVRRAGSRITVAVVSGRVRMADAAPDGDDERGTVVSAGDVAVATPRASLVTTAMPGRVDALTAWRNGMIVFEDVPLGHAVAEFNRYTPRPIRVDDPALAALRIGGSFRAGDRRAFVSLLRRAYGVTVRETTQETVLAR